MNPIQAILSAVGGLRGAIESRDPLAVLDALRPILVEYSMSPEVLTDERRDEIQARVLDTLRDARLIPTADFGDGGSDDSGE